MKYVSGLHALSQVCDFDTAGVPKPTDLDWKHMCVRESDGSIYGEYGITKADFLPYYGFGIYYVANTVRAILDSLAYEDYKTIENFRDEIICNERLNEEVFEKVSWLNKLPNWKDVDEIMHREYGDLWLRWKLTHKVE